MVSALWNASSAGNADAVRDLLQDAMPADLEVKDQFGVTPLIEAVRNAHTDIVKALLDKGADPTNPSAQGLPESYTSDPEILELLRFKAAARTQYPPPPPVPYHPYYAPPDPAAAAAFYPPPPPPADSGIGHLPPPDVARYIPCRYFPACRYGTSCMFAHPQQYYPGSLPPPAQYVAPYDMPHYPPFPPPPFQQGPVMSPPPPPHHGPSPSDVQPFSPTPIPPAPYVPMSPNAFPHPGQTPVPMIMPPLPPAAPLYNPPSSAPPYVQPEPSAYPVKPNGVSHDFNGDNKSLNPQDHSTNNHHPRDGPAHRRGGRRPSFGARKPPCLFFPAGRCKNGDDCRYPHVTPDANPPHHIPYFSGRGSKPPRQPNANGVNHVTDKLGNLTVRDDAPAQSQRNGAEGSTRPQQTDTNRPRYGGKNGYGQNGARADKRPPPQPKQQQQQRVPNADEFPVLGGTNTPPTRGANGLTNGHTGPTAAQVLSAPPPFRKDTTTTAGSSSSTRGPSPDSKSVVAVPKTEPNGVVLANDTTHDQPQAAAPVKLPISFAAVAAPELPKEIALSA